MTTTTPRVSRGFDGTLMKLWRGRDFEITVTGRTEVTPRYLRLHFAADDLLAALPVHPTMWVRLWFADGAKAHQRGYTLVDPDLGAGTVDIEFAMHDGAAARWAAAAEPGDVLEVTVLGTDFALPEPAPAGYVLVGDPASLPAINSLLAAIGEVPARVILEAPHSSDRRLPVHAGHPVTWVDRADGALVAAVRAAAFDASDHFGWVACDNRTTRAVTSVLREHYRIPKSALKSQAYWKV